ncbi:MAG: MOSC domain-containing protein [Beijerinckiaceae bacterium]
MAVIHSLFRYPVKGFSPEKLDQAQLETNGHFPGDRLFAVENGPSGFNPAAAEHLPKVKYLMLMKQERLARLRTTYTDETHTLSIRQGGAVVAAGDLRTPAGRMAIESFLTSYCGDELRGPAKVLTAPPTYRFMDSRSGYLSIIDLASVDAIAKAANRTSIDPLRFRANVYVEGLGAWGEFDLTGKQVKLGGATLEIIKPIDRCAATDVDPTAGIRDLRMVSLLESSFGHHDCGVYAKIIEGGEIRPGDVLQVLA